MREVSRPRRDGGSYFFRELIEKGVCLTSPGVTEGVSL